MGADRSQALAILRQKLDPTTLAIVTAALQDSDRLAVIRDAFMDGRDAEAVQMIRELDPIGIRKVLGCGTEGRVIGPAQSAQIVTRPQLPFSATHLVVSPSCAKYFNIEDIKVAYNSQFVQAGSIAADLFTVGDVLHGDMDEHGFYTVKIGKRAEAWMPLAIDMPECMPGQDIIVTITNIDTDPQYGPGHVFRAALMGRTRQH